MQGELNLAINGNSLDSIGDSLFLIGKYSLHQSSRYLPMFCYTDSGLKNDEYCIHHFIY